MIWQVNGYVLLTVWFTTLVIAWGIGHSRGMARAFRACREANKELFKTKP